MVFECTTALFLHKKVLQTVNVVEHFNQRILRRMVVQLYILKRKTLTL